MEHVGCGRNLGAYNVEYKFNLHLSMDGTNQITSGGGPQMLVFSPKSLMSFICM